MTTTRPRSIPSLGISKDARPLCVDLFCGYGGWASGFLDAGYRVVGFDIESKCEERYPGEFYLMDVHDIDGTQLPKPRIIVASPPCTEFSTMSNLNKYTHPADPYGKGMDLVHEATRIIYEAEPVYWCMENVRGAERYIKPKPRARNGPQSLWGFFPGFIASPKTKSIAVESYRNTKSRDPRNRALIPYPLARALAEACLPEPRIYHGLLPLPDTADAGRVSDSESTPDGKYAFKS